MTLSQLVQRITRAFPASGFLVNPVIKGYRASAEIAVWFDVWVYAPGGTIHVAAAPTPTAAWEQIEAAAVLKTAALDVFDVESPLALRERRRA